MALYAFDGTGDRWDKKSPITPTAKTKKGRYLTNVVFFYKEYVGSGLHAEYFPGVGSSISILDRVLGGAFGFGALGIANRAFGKLKANFRKGDNVIDIVGYSRGAAIARVFADKTYSDYKKLVDKNGKRLTEPPEIRFLGLFDTVASFGINPFNDNEIIFQEHLPRTVINAFHAMSLDLNRSGFGLDRAYGENVLEVWFRGGHGDIGGNAALENEPNRSRTNITLNFMLKKAIAAKVELKEENFDYPMNIKAPIVIKNNRSSGNDPSRQYRKHDVFHYSFFDEEGNEIKLEDVVITLPERNKLVIEELSNESQLSEQRLLQLTPEMAAKFPDTQSIYELLHNS